MSMFLSLWLALASSVPAAKLHKCVDAGGSTSYQALPCAPGQRSEWVRELPAAATTPPSTATPPSARTKAAPNLPARRAALPRTRPAPVRESVSRCRRARLRAQDQRDRLWNKLTFQQRSALDAEVARACR